MMKQLTIVIALMQQVQEQDRGDLDGVNKEILLQLDKAYRKTLQFMIRIYLPALKADGLGFVLDKSVLDFEGAWNNLEAEEARQSTAEALTRRDEANAALKASLAGFVAKHRTKDDEPTPPTGTPNS